MRVAFIHHLTVTCAASALLVSPSPADPPTILLDSLVVEADALRELENERRQSPVPFAGMTLRQMEDIPGLQLGDAIKYAPGVYLSGNINENDDLQIRGMPKGYSRTRISGIAIPDAGGEAREFKLNRLPNGLFKEAKIIRNPTAEYESDGIAGSLEMETIDIPQVFSNEMRLGFGARGSRTPVWDASILSGGRFDPRFGALGAFSYGFDPTMKNKNTTDYAADGTADKSSWRKENTPVDTYSAFLDGGFFYDSGEIHIKPLYLFRDIEKRSTKHTIKFEDPADEDESIDDDAEDRTERTAGATVTSLHRWSDTAKQETLLGFYQANERMPFSDTDSLKEDGGVFEYDGSSHEDYRKDDDTLDLQTKTTLDLATALRQQLKFGAAFRNRGRDSRHHLIETDEDGNVDDLTTDADEYHITEDYLAGFVQDQIWLNDRFSVLPGLRLEHQRQESRDGGGISSDRTMLDLNPAFHMLYQPDNGLTVRFGFSRTVNRPQFDQLSPFHRINDDDERVEVGNPDLDPARSWNFDLGADWNGGPCFLGVNLFYKKIHDIIQDDLVGTEDVGGDSYDLYQARNVGDGWLKGIELDQRFSFSKAGIPQLSGLEWWANESIYSSRVHFENGNTSSFEEQPGFIANIGLDYELAATRTVFSISGNFAGGFDWDETDGTNIGYRPEWIVNLAVRQPIAKGLEAFVEVSNLFDEERLETEKSTDGEIREEHITGGRLILAGLNYQF